MDLSWVTRLHMKRTVVRIQIHDPQHRSMHVKCKSKITGLGGRSVSVVSLAADVTLFICDIYWSFKKKLASEN
jgi:hypothetical protein